MSRSSIAFLICLLAAGASAQAAQIQWALFEPECAGSDSPLEVRCGDYGVFQLVHVEAVDGCDPVESGIDDPPVYPEPGHLAYFPTEPTQIGLSLSASGATSSTSALPSKESKVAHALAPKAPAPQLDPGWIAVIDFSGTHGSSIQWLVGAIAGPRFTTTLAKLDDPALSTLGPVSDFHVLAKLCEIVEHVDVDGAAPPRAVNMSFGRAAGADALLTADCTEDSAACQIAKVAEHLHARQTVLVAAAGNHQEMLFPAVLPDVLDVGMIDLGAFLKGGVVQPAWETPVSAKGLFPGNGLCLRGGWGAPAGASYAAAIYTGWLSFALDEFPGLDPFADGIWSPVLRDDLGCPVLALGPQTSSACNEQVTALFDKLDPASPGNCWFAATEPTETVPAPGEPVTQPGVPSLTNFSATTHATPESDPCVPCVGVTFAQNVSLDFSLSHGLAAGTYLDSVYLRVGSSFYTVWLSPSQIAAIQNGNLAALVLNGYAPLLVPGAQISLWYEMKTDPLANCQTSTACFWSSTPVYLETE